MKLGEWSGAAVEAATGGTPPDADEWVPVDLPGSPARFAGADCVTYRTQFDDPRESEETRALLTLRGCYARTRVWLNGDLLGTHDTYFEPAKFVFEPAAENDLVVECRRPDDRFGGVHETDLLPPEAKVPAIWWDAEVESLPAAGLVDVHVRPEVTDEHTAFRAQLTIDAARRFEDEVTFSLRPEGFRAGGTMKREPVSAAAGERTTVERSIEVLDPKLWYPRGYGPQNRYTLAIKLAGREETVSTGLRTIEYDDGFLVNGRLVRARGFDLLPPENPCAVEAFGSEVTRSGGDGSADTEWAADVERAAEANANLLRAHAHVPPQELYEACNAAGLLVWQDLPLTGEGGYDIDRGRDLAGKVFERYRHHPSQAAFGVHDDPREVFSSPIGGGRTGRARLRWRAWRTDYNATADEAVAEGFPDEAIVFPVIGPAGIDADATTLYPGWDYGSARDIDWLLKRNPDLGRIVAEFGAGALAGDETGAATEDPKAEAAADGAGEIAGFDRSRHDTRVSGGVEDSQAYQARVLKTVAEALRRKESHTLAAFALRDTDAAGMGVLARDGTPKAGYEAITDSYEPVQVVLDGDPRGSVGTTVLNDSPELVEGTVSWRAGENEGSAEVSVDTLDRTDGPDVTVPKDAEEVVLELELPDRTVENRYRC